MFAHELARKYERKLRGNAFLYRFVRGAYIWMASHNVRKTIKGKNNVITNHGAILREVDFRVVGDGNKIEIGENCILQGVTFHIKGSFNEITIGKRCLVKRCAELWIEDEHCRIKIGQGTTMEHAHIAATEPGSSITIGDDCMLANDIDVRTGDSHSILDRESGKRLNPAQNVVIEDHVWIAAHVTVLKGVTLGAGSVIGTGSVVTRSVGQNCIAAGVPATVKREGIVWRRERIYGRGL